MKKTVHEHEKDLIFSEPWQAELFALTVSLHEKGFFEWGAWTKTLGKNLKLDKGKGKDDLTRYFKSWLNALEETLLEKKVTNTKNIKIIAEAWREAISKTPHGKKVEISDAILKTIL